MKLQYELVVAVVMAVSPFGSRTVLVFVAGMADIEELTEKFQHVGGIDGKRIVTVPIHSDIPIEAQLEMFNPPAADEIKVIIATNAVE